MRVIRKNRKYMTGMTEKNIRISHCADIRLQDNEQITFKTKTGQELDFCAKSWGFYPAPSLNSRLLMQGFKTALVRNPLGRVFINVVHISKMQDFLAYLQQEKGLILEWLDERPVF